jgi:hypothetical protein
LIRSWHPCGDQSGLSAAEHRHVARDEQPPSWFLGVDLLPGEEIRVIRQKLLQKRFRVVGRLVHCNQLGFAVQKVNAACHLITCIEKTQPESCLRQRCAEFRSSILPFRAGTVKPTASSTVSQPTGYSGS